MKAKKSKKEMTIDDLAVIVQNQFLDMEERIGKKIEKEAKGVKTELKANLKSVKNELKAELNKKVDIFTHKSLEFRVEKVEERVGIGRKK